MDDLYFPLITVNEVKISRDGMYQIRLAGDSNGGTPSVFIDLSEPLMPGSRWRMTLTEHQEVEPIPGFGVPDCELRVAGVMPGKMITFQGHILQSTPNKEIVWIDAVVGQQTICQTNEQAHFLGVWAAPWGEDAVYFQDGSDVYVLDFYAQKAHKVSK